MAKKRGDIKPTILIVDDELSIRKLLEYYLGKNYLIVLKNDGVEALNWLSIGNKPDAIIADIDMPIINGKDFLVNIKAEKKLNQIPVIMISGREEPSDRIECFSLGADDYFPKPFNPHEVEVRIINLINNRVKSYVKDL